MSSLSDTVWAAWLGAGLLKDMVKVLSRRGMPQPHQFMFRVLALLHLIVHGNKDMPVPCPCIKHPSD